MTRKNSPVVRWAGVSATSPGRKNLSVCRSRPCQPSTSQRPNAANSRPMPPSKAISDSTLQTRLSAVGELPTSGSGGQLLVYE